MTVRSLPPRGRETGKRATPVALFFFLLLPTAASGHDLWLEPSTFVSPAGERLDIDIRLGHADSPETQARDGRRIVHFEALGPLADRDAATVPVLGLEGARPAGVLRPQAPGRYVVGYRTTDARSELPAERFESYLLEEGLEAIRDVRRERGEADSPGTERFSRAAKALITIGTAESTTAKSSDPQPTADRRLGFRLELVAEEDPSRWQDGGSMTFRLWFEDRPRAGARVDAISLDEPGVTLDARTDDDGRVTFRLPRGGRWFVAAVHMVETPPSVAEDWQSIWSSLSFLAGPVSGVAPSAW